MIIKYKYDIGHRVSAVFKMSVIFAGPKWANCFTILRKQTAQTDVRLNSREGYLHLIALFHVGGLLTKTDFSGPELHLM